MWRRNGSSKRYELSDITSPEFKVRYLRQMGIQVGQVIGEGSYSKVRLAVQGSYRMATKVMSRLKASKEFVDHFLPRELKLLTVISHPNIVKIHRIIDFHDDVYVFMEFADGGDLLQHIQKRGFLPENEARVIFRQLLDAVIYLHNQGIYHRDLKCENVLMHSDGTALLTDFGFCKTDMKPGELSRTFCGSPAYASPELIKGEPYLPSLNDAWSLGVILFAMVTGRMPFDFVNLPKILKDQGIFHITEDHMKRLSQSCQNLLHLILEPDKKYRLTVKRIQHHPWMRDYSSSGTVNTSMRR